MSQATIAFIHADDVVLSEKDFDAPPSIHLN